MALPEMIPGAIVERVHRVFAVYPPDQSMDACSHCVEEEARARLPRIPLRELTCDDLSRFAFKAMTTWGGALDYKHFLPRILELATTEEGRYRQGFDLGAVAEKLEMAGWTAWPDEERAAVLAWFEALRQAVASADPDQTPWSLGEVVEAISRLI